MEANTEELKRLSLGKLVAKIVGLAVSTPDVLSERCTSISCLPEHQLYRALVDELDVRERNYLEYAKTQELCRKGAGRSDF
jgi:hypothetical protein